MRVWTACVSVAKPTLDHQKKSLKRKNDHNSTRIPIREVFIGSSCRETLITLETSLRNSVRNLEQGPNVLCCLCIRIFCMSYMLCCLILVFWCLISKFLIDIYCCLILIPLLSVALVAWWYLYHCLLRSFMFLLINPTPSCDATC